MVELADSSVNFVVRPWVNASDYWGVYMDTTEKIKKAFDAAGISIPYPQRDVHVYKHDVT
jgi:small conductance mechanosensitive channel